jgi:hypothetical protein
MMFICHGALRNHYAAPAVSASPSYDTGQALPPLGLQLLMTADSCSRTHALQTHMP